MEAILPISVRMPVEITTPSPRPYTTGVDIKTSLIRSPTPDSLERTKSAFFSTGRDSPVSEDSSVFKEKLLIKRKSAGTVLPSSKITISPTTRFSAGISTIFPSLLTVAVGADIFFKASKAFSAFISWMVPIKALIKTTPKIIKTSANPSGPSLSQFNMAKTREIIAAIASTNVIGSAMLSQKILYHGSPLFS